MTMITTLEHDTLLVSTHSKGRAGKHPTKIVVHHEAGMLTAKDLQRVFISRKSSATYGIDKYGHITQYVPEGDRPWTTSGADPDNYCITIELANDAGAPSWHISDATITACVNLCADICRRYSIPKLYYDGKNGTLLRHCDYHATACPGPYFKSITDDFCNRVNTLLKSNSEPARADDLYRVQVGAFSNKQNAERLQDKLKQEGYSAIIKEGKKE